MARASSAIVKEMLPLIDTTYAVRSKSMLLNTIALYKPEHKKDWFESAIAAPNAKSEVETKATLLADYTAASIDALTRADIFETVMWPKISAYSPGWSDHPEDKAPPLGSSMKGVVYSTVYEGNPSTDFSAEFHKLFGKKVNLTLPEAGWLDQTTPLATDFKKLKELSIELGENFSHDLSGYENINNKKALLNDLFSNENAVKLWFIETVLLNHSFANPFSAMGIDPYFGYLLMFMGWKGGTKVFTEIKGKISYQGSEEIKSLKQIVNGAINGQWLSNDQPTNVNWAVEVAPSDGKEQSVRAYIPNYSTKFLECYAAWLQGIKAEKPEYYKDWYDKLITDRFSLINMLVLINELVNIPGTTNRFTYNPTAGQYLAALSEKYKTFEITIGD